MSLNEKSELNTPAMEIIRSMKNIAEGAMLDRDFWRNKYYAAMNNRAREIKCPHCESTLNFNATMLDTINAACATTPHQPDRIVGQWRLFFNGYTGSQRTVNVIGFAIAFHADRQADKRIPYLVAGVEEGEVKIAMPGEEFDSQACETFNWCLQTEQSLDLNTFVYAKQRALDKLVEFVKTLPGSKG